MRTKVTSAFPLGRMLVESQAEGRAVARCGGLQVHVVRGEGTGTGPWLGGRPASSGHRLLRGQNVCFQGLAPARSCFSRLDLALAGTVVLLPRLPG